MSSLSVGRGQIRTLTRAGQIVWASVKGWSHHRCARLGAAISFYTTFSLAPVLVVALALAALLFGEPGTRSHLVDQIGDLVGPDAAKTVEAALASARFADSGLVATGVALLTILIGASGVMIELRDALNRIFGAPEDDENLWETVKQRLLGISLLLSVGFLLLVSLVLNATLTAMFHWISPRAQWLAGMVGLLDFLASVLLTSAFFALLMRWLPARRPRMVHIVAGSVVGALLFAIGKLAIGLYLGNTAVASAYGASGSIIVIMVWVYYSAQIFLFGAEIARNASTTRQRG